MTRREGPDERTWGDAIRAWQDDAAFRAEFIEELAAACEARAFFWETPPVSADLLDARFEWMTVPAPALDGTVADPTAFRAHIGGRSGVAVFANLGGDAQLVVPCADADPSHYPHLGAFARGAPRAQVHALWKAVGRALQERLAASDAPVWVSTAGLGVPWVHVRLDERPKYYQWAPYREAGV